MKHFAFVIVILVIVFILNACSSISSGTGTTIQDPIGQTPQYAWTTLGPQGGFIASIAFHPTRTNEVWLSGDDSSGLYVSNDSGLTWKRSNTPANQSSYALAFDPADPLKIYALNHFGRGVLKSTDGGVSWIQSQAGLPSTGSNKRIYRIAINPIHPERIVAATDDGLYITTDSASSFSKLKVSWGNIFKGVAYSSTGRLFAGATNGVFKYSDNDGATWQDLGVGAGEGVFNIATSLSAVYILFDRGSLVWYQLPDFSNAGIINTIATITNGNQMGFSVKSGISQTHDLLYFGTTQVGANPTAWGLFKSTNGGGSWTRQNSGIGEESIFSVAISPHDSNLVIAGSSKSGGVYRTTDGGNSWESSSTGVMAHSALGFAQNPANSSELLLSSTVGYGWGKSFHSIDAGHNWSVIPEVNPADGVTCWDIDPLNSNNILAGLLQSGIYRSNHGAGGPWTQVLSKNVRIGRIYRDKINPDLVYAVAIDGLHDASGGLTNTAEVRVYVSTDNGHSFSIRAATFAPALAIHPFHSGEAVAFWDDAYFTTDGFATQHSLGLSAQAASEGGALVAGAFHPTRNEYLVVGGKRGGIYLTTSYNTAGDPITWTTLNTPVAGTLIRDIVVRVEAGKTVFYLTTLASDVNFSPSCPTGLYVSYDEGATWTELSANLRPCTSFLWFYPQNGPGIKFWAGLYGGGIVKLEKL